MTLVGGTAGDEGKIDAAVVVALCWNCANNTTPSKTQSEDQSKPDKGGVEAYPCASLRQFHDISAKYSRSNALDSFLQH